jgi:hypothetical protein
VGEGEVGGDGGGREAGAGEGEQSVEVLKARGWAMEGPCGREGLGRSRWSCLPEEVCGGIYGLALVSSHCGLILRGLAFVSSLFHSRPFPTAKLHLKSLTISAGAQKLL